MAFKLTMIPRRARIKGIANIPARRKTDATIAISSNSENNVKTEQTTPEKKEIKPESIVNKPDIKNEEQNNIDDIKKESIPTQISQKSEPTSTTNDETTNSKITSGNPETKNQENPETINQENPETTKTTTEIKPTTRRWIPKPKPMVSIGAVSRRPKPNLITSKEKESTINQNIENEIPEDRHQQQEHNSTENEVNSSDKQNTPITLTPESPVCNVTSDLNDSRIRSNSESDKIPTTPLSPNKIINRTRIRPSPKLIRRNSIQGSASESEDDTRRTYNRIRNDSVCSTASYTTENLNTSDSASSKQKNM